MDGPKIPRPLSAKYKEDFAYPTVKDRLPVILTKAIDTLHRSKSKVLSDFGEEGCEDLKGIVGSLSKLRNELQTNKPLIKINDNRSDQDLWNNYLETDKLAIGEDSTWFVSAWLYTECYFYRRIMESIYNSKLLQHLDPFKDQKCNALNASMPAVVSLAEFLKTSCEQADNDQQKDRFLKDFIQICLWGNKCDLSISAGVENAQKINVENSLDSLHPHILCDQKALAAECLLSTGNEACVHIVLDNAGFELFSDLVLIEFLLASKLASSVTMHGKSMPWFVSDVTIEDLEWTISQLETSPEEILKYYGRKWRDYLDKGTITYKANNFWTSPYDFSKMENIDPDLYEELTLADLVIFKGDLNYRKLVGDFKWEYDTKFTQTLRGFLPTAVCALRTIKCDLAVGITNEIAKKTEEADKDWLYDAKWGLIQFAK